MIRQQSARMSGFRHNSIFAIYSPEIEREKSDSRSLADQRHDCIFASPIAVMAPLWEALAARRERGDPEVPPLFPVPSRDAGCFAASGYYKATGRAQAADWYRRPARNQVLESTTPGRMHQSESVCDTMASMIVPRSAP